MRIHDENDLREGFKWLNFLIEHGPVDDDIARWEKLVNKQIYHINNYLITKGETKCQKLTNS